MRFLAAITINEDRRYSHQWQEQMDHSSVLCAARKQRASHQRRVHRSWGSLQQGH